MSGVLRKPCSARAALCPCPRAGARQSAGCFRVGLRYVDPLVCRGRRAWPALLQLLAIRSHTCPETQRPAWEAVFPLFPPPCLHLPCEGSQPIGVVTPSQAALCLRSRALSRTSQNSTPRREGPGLLRPPCPGAEEAA